MIAVLLDALRFLVRARALGLVIVLVALTLLAVAVGAVVAKVRRALRRQADRRATRNLSSD